MAVVLPRLGIRGRLIFSLALLALATLTVGAIAWTALDRADRQLDGLHRQTVAQVARTMRLSRQSSDIATSAPFLLNFPSEHLIESERAELARTLDQIVADWPNATADAPIVVYPFAADIRDAVVAMRGAIDDLARVAREMAISRRQVIGLLRDLDSLERLHFRQATDFSARDPEIVAWQSLQAMARELGAAGYASNLLGMGEHQRRYRHLVTGFAALAPNILQSRALSQLESFANAPDGLLETRRQELALRLQAQNALFRIRHNATQITQITQSFAADVEGFLVDERSKALSALRYWQATVTLIALASVLIAFGTAAYVSGYVTENIRLIATTMQRLANGDRAARLPGREQSVDEIGTLRHAFRAFRATALRLDRSNRHLQQQNALFQSIFTHISEGILISDAQGTITAQNPALSKVLGAAVSPLTRGQPVAQVLPDVHTDQAQPGGQTREIQSASGATLEVRSDALPDGGAIWLFRDITARREVEARLREVQRIEALGKLTGEVAHDFGNVLAGVSTNLHLITQSQDPARAEQFAQRARSAIDHGTTLVQRLLAFARRQPLITEIVDLNELVAGMEDLLSISLQAGVDLVIQTQPEPLFVAVDAGQLEAAILNLVVNANHAISGAGQISISVSAADDTALIAVSDNGSGMNSEVRDKAFEPFFTTRSDGSGTGLGLSTVHGFINQSGGRVELETAPGIGTTLRLFLPCLTPGNAVAPVPGHCPALLVEDSPADRDHAVWCFARSGVTPLVVSSLGAARETLRAHPGIGFLVTDLELDGAMVGFDLAADFLAQRDDRVALVLTGKQHVTLPAALRHDPRVMFAQKPASPLLVSQFLAKLHEAEKT